MTTVTKLSELIMDIINEYPVIKKTLEKGEYLYQEGEKSNYIYLILQGKINLYTTTPDGFQFISRVVSEGDILGEYLLSTSTKHVQETTKVMEKTNVVVLTIDEFQSLLSMNQYLSNEVMKYIILQNQKTQTKLRDLLLYGKKGALYSTLLRLANTYGIETDVIYIPYSITNQELANFCGTSREVVNRLLKELKEENVLQVEKSKITIFDIEYLKQAICCENCPKAFCTIN